MATTITCFMCNSKTSFSYHRFPKNEIIRESWLKVCNVTTEDNIRSLRICSKHFQKDDFVDINARRAGGIIKLKPTAVPCHSLNEDIASESSIREELNTTSTSSTFGEVCASNSSKSIPQEQQLIVTPELCTTRKRKQVTPRYVGDLSEADVATPRDAKRSLEIAKREIIKQRKQIKSLQQQKRRMAAKIKTLKDLVSNLKKGHLLSEEAVNNLMDSVPDHVKEIIKRNLHNKKQKYSPELRQFALTLQYYSPKAYNYVRRKWKNLLPHSSTIQNWYSNINCKPGFQQHTLDAVARQNNKSLVLLNIVIDEMAIREQLVYSNNEVYGGVDLGSHMSLVSNNDNLPKATHALVFMGVALNGSFKVPLAYFFITTLTGQERACLLRKCFELVNHTGAKIMSIVFDGAPSNLSMCTCLGANFSYPSPKFKPWIINPFNNEKIFIFWDACHMLKLVRNTLGDKKSLMDKDGGLISWEYISNLHKYQQEHGLHCASKLTNKHVNFNNNRMNVRLAAQTLSESTCKALMLLKQLEISQFVNCEATAMFCSIFNNCFDILNCKNQFSKRNLYNIPLNEKHFPFLQEQTAAFIFYISNLCDSNGKSILLTNRKTGFLGFIINLNNVLELYSFLHQQYKQEYLLTFKLSQDPLETFFSVIRSRGGFNNNPNAKQFESAFRRILLKNEISSNLSNCLADGLDILHVSSKQSHIKDLLVDADEICKEISNEHDYLQTAWSLTPYVMNVVNYIAGFIVSKLLKKISCACCQNELLGTEESNTQLIKLKNRGPYIYPGKDVKYISQISEKIIRQHLHILFHERTVEIIKCKAFAAVESNIFSSETIINHIKSQDLLDNHRVQLIKAIINIYVMTRMHYECKLGSEKNEYVRQKYTKLIHFYHS